MSRRSLLAGLTTGALLVSGLALAGPVQASPYGHVYTVTEVGACGGQGQPDPVGSFGWAVRQANATPGLDKIVLPKDGWVSFAGCFGDAGPRDPFRAQVLDAVDIVGDNTTLTGGNTWANSGGYVNPVGACPSKSNGSVLMAESGGVLEVGDLSGSPVAAVSITGVTMQRLSAIATVRPNSSLDIEHSTIRNTQDILAGCGRDPIFVDHGQVVLRDVTWNFTDTPTKGEYSGAIAGVDSTIVLDTVDMSFALNGRAINILGKASHVYVSNSVISESGGFRTEADPLYFTNSVFYTDLTTPQQRIDVYDGIFYAVASSFHFGGQTLANPLWQHGRTAALWMLWSAVGANPDSEPLIAVEHEEYVHLFESWIQPTTNQTRNQLLLTVPGVMAWTPGLPTGTTYTSVPPSVLPIAGSQLLGFIHDAGPGGVNELKDPLTQTPILTDVFGNPRVSGTGTRDIGAMQSADPPVVSVVGTTVTSVSLAWTPDTGGTLSGPFTGWRVQWRPVSDTPGSWQELDVDGWATQSTTVPGLSTGTPYEFRVAGIQSPPTPATVGTFSQPTLGIPTGPVGVPTPGGTGHDASVTLAWTEPDLAGHPGPLTYSVLYRKLGTTTWFAGPSGISGRITQIPGLTNAVTYEFGVVATADDGASSPTAGTTTATPYAQPTLTYPNDVTVSVGGPFTLPPAVTDIVGTPTYTLRSGALPAGVTLSSSTGVISGTPTMVTPQTVVVVRVTDATSGLYAEDSVAITVDDLTPVAWLSYADVMAVAGLTSVAVPPATSGIPPGATFAMVTGDTLPAGLTLDPATGAVTGTPTTAPGAVVTLQVKATWDDGSPRQRVAPLDLYIAPKYGYPNPVTGVVGRTLTATPSVTTWAGGVFSLRSGEVLPSGLALDPATGVVSGTVAAPLDLTVGLEYTTGLTAPGATTVPAALHLVVRWPAPTLTSISPAIGASSGGVRITLNGKDFHPGMTAQLGVAGTCDLVDVISATRATCVPSPVRAGAHALTVTTSGGTSNARTFTAIPRPVVATVAPASGSPRGGTRISLTGSNFRPGMTVTVAGRTCTTVAVLSSSRATCTTPSGKVGSAAVAVTTIGGTSATKPFRYVWSALRTTTTRVYFLGLGSTLGATQKARIDALLRSLPRGALVTEFRIKGWVQRTGQAKNDYVLSYARAAAAKNYLLTKGVTVPIRLTAGGSESATAASRAADLTVVYRA